MREYKLQRFRGGWAIAIYEQGKRLSRKQLGARDAGAAAEEFRALVAQWKRPKDPTVGDIWAAYREDRQGRVIAGNMEFSGKAAIPYFGGMKPDDIDTGVCRAYVAKRRKEGRQDGTIGTELGHLRIALSWAAKTGLIETAPAIERPSRPAPKDRHLTRHEIERLLDAAVAPHIRLFILLAISTAGRSAALLDLTWDRVDFHRGLIYLGARDANRPQKGRATVPMTDGLRAALAVAKEGARTDYVIEWAGRRVKKVRRGIDSAAERAHLRDVTPHVLRHSAAVMMAEAGIPMSEIAQYLGHSDPRITERVYALYSPDHLRKAANVLDFGGVRSALRSR